MKPLQLFRFTSDPNSLWVALEHPDEGLLCALVAIRTEGGWILVPGRDAETIPSTENIEVFNVG